MRLLHILLAATQRLLMSLFRWSPTALWASTSGAFARRLPASLGDSRASEGTEGESGAPAGLLASFHRVLAIGQGALDQLRSSAQQALLPQQPREQEQVRGTSSVAADDPCKAARTTASWWSPWTAAPARPAHTAPQVHLSHAAARYGGVVCIHLHTFTHALGV